MVSRKMNGAWGILVKVESENEKLFLKLLGLTGRHALDMAYRRFEVFFSYMHYLNENLEFIMLLFNV